MREKFFTYNNNEYRVTLKKDRLGFRILDIDKKEKIFFFTYWSMVKSYMWDFIDENKDMNPVEFAMEILKIEDRKKAEKEEYEKKLDEWFK